MGALLQFGQFFGYVALQVPVRLPWSQVHQILSNQLVEKEYRVISHTVCYDSFWVRARDQHDDVRFLPGQLDLRLCPILW